MQQNVVIKMGINKISLLAMAAITMLMLTVVGVNTVFASGFSDHPSAVYLQQTAADGYYICHFNQYGENSCTLLIIDHFNVFEGMTFITNVNVTRGTTQTFNVSWSPGGHTAGNIQAHVTINDSVEFGHANCIAQGAEPLNFYCAP